MADSVKIFFVPRINSQIIMIYEPSTPFDSHLFLKHTHSLYPPPTNMPVRLRIKVSYLVWDDTESILWSFME